MRITLLSMMATVLFSYGTAQTNEQGYTITTVEPQKQASGYREIHTEQLYHLLNGNPSITVVDARLPKHDNGHRLPGAKFIPYDSFDDAIETALPDKNAPIIVYCASIRCPVSKYMSERLVSLNYQNVTRYPEGLEGWEKQGYPIDRVKPTHPQDIAESKAH